MFKDRVIQNFRKEKHGWNLTTTKGKVYPCTAEQIISYILPPLAGIKGQDVAVEVKPNNKTENQVQD